MIAHRDALAVLARRIPDDNIVVSLYGTAIDWQVLRPHPLNYFSVGAMGLAAAHGLGLALGRPDRRVVVIDGDGSLTMALGTLITVAENAPRNFVHILWENGAYQANGGHSLPGAGKVDFPAIVRAAGYRSVHVFDDLAQLEQQAGAVLAEDGPVFAAIKIAPEPAPERVYSPLRGQKLRDDLKAELRRTSAAS